MRRQIPSDIDVFLEQAKVQTAGGDVTDFADVALVHDFFNFADDGRIQKRVTGHEHETVFLGDVHQFFALFNGGSHRFFDERVLASEQRGFRKRKVGLDVGSDDDGVQVDAVEHMLVVGGGFNFGVKRLEMFEATGIQIAHHLEVHVRQRTEVTNEVRSPVTATRHADFDFL